MKLKKQAELKTGGTLMMRSLGTADAGAVLALVRRTAAESDHMTRYPDEWHVTEEKEAALIRAAEMNPREIMLGAFLDGRLAGLCQCRLVSDADRHRHRAGVGVAVLRAYWNRGIGTALMQAAIDALGETNLEQLELSVVSTNAAAIALYEKLGFVRYGCLRHAMKHRDGSYADMLLMALDLREKR